MTAPNDDLKTTKTGTEKKENMKDTGEVSLDPNPSKALGELVTGGENNTSDQESSSKD